ncbi:MAG: hypothetical protein SGARI_001108 [Bacillariaceae sp.]
MFSTESSPRELGNQVLPPAESPRAETQWDELFMAQLRPLAPASPPVAPPTLLGGVSQPPAAAASQVAAGPASAGFVSFQANAAKAKRKRSPRKKIVPESKEYVLEPTNEDIFCGRVENLKQWYNSLDDKDEKTDLSQCLVDYVKSYGARFLERDEKGWYVIDNITARRKVSQALREDTDPEKRQAKRQRFLAKKARRQQQVAVRGEDPGA